MAADPIRAVQKLDGRPLLMINGRHDRTVTPDQAERLYAAASQPKELRWFPTGHTLRVDAIDDDKPSLLIGQTGNGTTVFEGDIEIPAQP